MDDLRDVIRAAAPEMHDYVRRLWPERDRLEYCREREAAARKHRFRPAPGDHHARTAVKGVASVLLRHQVSPWLSRDLSHCWNEARVPLPLDDAEVDGLVNDAAADERRHAHAA